MKDWGWKSGRISSTIRVGSMWLRTLSIVIPLVTVGLLLLLFQIVGGALTTAKGVLFDLPETCIGEGEATESVAMLVPVRHETLVFFDDSRYVLGSEASMRSFEERLAERFVRSERKTLLVLADRRVSCGDLMAFSERVRRRGVERVLFAEKRAQEASE